MGMGMGWDGMLMDRVHRISIIGRIRGLKG